MNSVDQFAKTLNKIIEDRDSKKPTPKDDRVTVTKVEGDTVWVHFPGGVDETPVQRTLDAKVGDTVTVRRAEGKAWITGNNSSPPTDDSTANYALDITNKLDKDVVVLNTLVADNIEATNARFGYVEADTAKIHTLEADEIHAGITYTNELIAQDVTTENLTAASGYIQDLASEHITTEDISAATGYIGDLTSKSITTDDLSAATGFIGDLTAGDITAQNVIADHATVGSLDANYAKIADLNAAKGRIDDLEVNEVVVNDTLKAANANIDYLKSDWISTDRLVLTGNNKNNYPPVEITEAEFNVNKTAYWTKSGDTYIQCTTSSVYDPDEQYYVRQNVKSIIEAINTANSTDPQVVVSNDKLIAASMDVAELSAITADMGELTAGKIKKGNNFINLDTSPASMEFKNASTWANATQGLQFDTQGNLNIKGKVTITAGSNVPTTDEMNSAIDDLQSEIDAKKSVHTLDTSYSYNYANILTYSAEGYGGESGASWTVSSTDGVKAGDTVRLKVTVSDMNNAPVYIVGTVRSVTSNTVLKATSHGIDTTIIDGGNIIANSVGATQIKANSINAEHLAISDSTNLATVNPFYEGSLPTSLNTSWLAAISGGYIVKKSATQNYLMVTSYTSSSFKTGDELYYEFDGKVGTAGTIQLYAWAWDRDYQMVANNSAPIAMGTSEGHYSGTIKLSHAGWNTGATEYILGFYDGRTTPPQLYIRNLIIRRKSGGELIVDGTLTVGALSESAKNDVLNSKLHFGGRNLIRMLVSGNGTVVGNNQNPNFYFDPDNGGEYWIRCNTAGGGNDWTQIYNNPYWQLPASFAGKEAIFHADYIHASNSTVDERVYLVFYNSSGANIKNVSLNETTLSATFTIPSDATHYQLIIRMDQQCKSLVGDTMVVRGIKFELGNVATAWTMAPEDIYSGGENLYEGATFPFSGHGLTVNLDSDGWFRVTGTCTNTAAAIINPTGNWPNTKYKGGAYTLSIEDDGVIKDGKVGVQFYRYRPSGQEVCPIFYTTGSHFASVEPNGYILRVCIFLTAQANGTTINGRIRWKLERGTQSSDWSHANNQITDINGNGIRVHPANTVDNSAVINTDGLEIFRGGTTSGYSVAKFGSSARVGKDADKHISISSSGVSIWSGTESTTTNKLAEFGSSIKLFRPGTSTEMVRINSDGSASFTGAISAVSGTIGGYDITSNSIQAQVDGNGNKVATGNGLFWHFMSWGANNLGFGIGSRASTSAAWTWKFLVNHDGKLQATGADIAGKITATEGTIGGCSINSSGQLQVPEANISGTLGASKIRVSEINIGSLSGANNYIRPNLIRSVQNYNITMSNSNATYSYNRRNGALLVTAVSAGSAQVYVTDAVYQPERFVGQKMTLSTEAFWPSKDSLNPHVFVYCIVNGSAQHPGIINKTNLTSTFTVPTGVTKMGIIYRVDQNFNCAAGDHCWFTRVKLELGDTATRWVPEDTDGSAAPFITNIGSTGITIHPEDSTTNYAQLDANGMRIYKNSVSVAEYGDTARIGKDASPHISVDSNGFHIWQATQSTASNEVASFSASSIELGKNSISSVISLCGGKGTIERHNTLGLLICTTESDKSVTLRTPSHSRVEVAPNSIELYVDTYTYLEINANDERIYMGSHTQPAAASTSTDTGYYLGLKAYRWRQLYCWSAPNTGSDGKRKDVLGNIDFAKELIMGLEPVEFQWKDSDHIRSHMGFIAQDAAKVGKALGKDLSFYEAGYIDESKGDYHGEEVSDEELSWGMMYDELIAPLVKVVQMQQKEIDQLKIELKHIEAEVTE